MQIQTAKTYFQPLSPGVVACSRVACILEFGGGEGTHLVTVPRGQEVSIGSSPEADIRVRDPKISARHASVILREQGLFVRDLGSDEGVFVDGTRVPSAVVDLDCGRFTMGRTSVTVRCATAQLPGDSIVVAGLIGNSAPMRRLRREILRLAPLTAPVLVLGESGTGKDVVARTLHALSGRSGEYLPLNVGAISESLADSELFGHVRGAFTGALQSRVGAFEQADGGTLLLDEVADLAPSIQVKLLRVIEDGTIRAVGASQSKQVRTRVVSATWADLGMRVAQGAFRADLFHRISTVVLRIPPLRERKGDILPLSRHLLGRVASDVGVKQLTSAALAALAEYSWPGNIRELSSVLYRAAVASDTEHIDESHVVGSLPVAAIGRSGLGADAAARLLAAQDGNISRAARAAGVARSTFRGWLQRPLAEGDVSAPSLQAQNVPTNDSP